MNLITDKWIDVVRADGTYDTIAPHQLAERVNPPVDFDGGLPTIDGGYVLFLIHLFQTAIPPRDEEDWYLSFEDPPAVPELKNQLAKMAYAFDVDGDSFRYMQAPPESDQKKSLLEKIGESRRKGESNGLPLLLCGSASANKMNQTIFGLKNLDPDPIPLKHAAAMLTWIQASGKTNAFGRSGSALRKNGCVNVVVKGETLWETVWANVLPEGDFYEYVTSRDWDSANIEEFEFPWMQSDFNPSDVHHGRDGFNPLSMLWFMPSWSWFDLTSDCKVANVVGESTGKGNAKDGWKHPLSGWDPNRSEANPLRLSKDLNVESWVDIRFPKSGNKSAKMPKVMERAIYGRFVPPKIKEIDKVWILSTVVDGVAKAVYNVNDQVPLMTCSARSNDTLKGLARRMKKYGGQAIKDWDKAVKRTNMSTGKDIYFKNKTDIWSNLESRYLDILGQYREYLETKGNAGTKEAEQRKKMLLEQWTQQVDECVLEAFDSHLMVDKFAVTTYKYDRNSSKQTVSAVTEKSCLKYNLNDLKEEVL